MGFLWLSSCKQGDSYEPIPVLPSQTFASAFDAAPHIDTCLQRLERLCVVSSIGEYPLTNEKSRGTLISTPVTTWTSGFFPASLWLAYEATGDPFWCAQAAKWTLGPLLGQATNASTHDLGFMVGLPALHAYRLTGDSVYKQAIRQAAQTLQGRFHAEVGAMRSWDHGDWQYPIIMDNMMNLNLWLAVGDTLSRNMAIAHGDFTLAHHVYGEGRYIHVIDINPQTGEILARETTQGYADSSLWARGQAWGIYGFAQLHQFTKLARYRTTALELSEYYVAHAPSDMIPYWDFDDPEIPHTPRDASAAAIAAAGMLLLAEHEPDTAIYRRLIRNAKRSLQALSHPEYRATAPYFVLDHAIGNVTRDLMVDQPIIWGDYFYLEALLRWQQIFGSGGGRFAPTKGPVFWPDTMRLLPEIQQ